MELPLSIEEANIVLQGLRSLSFDTSAIVARIETYKNISLYYQFPFEIVDINNEIIKYLSDEDLFSLLKVSKRSYQLASNDRHWPDRVETAYDITNTRPVGPFEFYRRMTTSWDQWMVAIELGVIEAIEKFCDPNSFLMNGLLRKPFWPVVDGLVRDGRNNVLEKLIEMCGDKCIAYTQRRERYTCLPKMALSC